MPERWQQELRKLRTVEPSEDLWERAVLRAGRRAGLAALPVRAGQPWRALWSAVGTAIAVALIAAAVSLGHGSHSGRFTGGQAGRAGTYTDPQFGWTVRYPAGLTVQHFAASVRWPVDGIRVTNFTPNLSDRTGAEPDTGWLRSFPRSGVAIQIWYLGTPGLTPLRSTPLPLGAGSFTRIRPYAGGTEPAPVYRAFAADGYTFSVAVWTGPAAHRAAIRSIWRVIASLRFPDLRQGSIWHGTYVLGRVSAYPLGSVTEFPPTALPRSPRLRHPKGFFLVHRPHAFYVVEEEFQSPVRPYQTCQLAFDRAVSQFYCPGTSWRWDRSGQPTRSSVRAGHDQDLQLRAAAVSGGDHILYGPSFSPLSPGTGAGRG